MTAPRTPLARLFSPRSVAVVGASSAPEKAGHQAVAALASFPGEVFAINPKAEPILGRAAFPSLRALGRPVDLVLFAVPAAACVDAVREAIECACGGGVVLSGGFAESGARGAALQAELLALSAHSEFRLLGPNTAGFVNKDASLTASFVPATERLKPGAIAVVAQSAGVNLTVSFLLEKLGAGISLAVGLGNAIDVDAAAVLEHLAESESTRAIALHLEGVGRGRQLYETLRRVTPKKPVVVLTVGKGDIGEFAASHTGNLIGSYSLRLNALRQAGAVIVDSVEELALAATVLAQHRLPANPRPGIAIVTAQAGPGLMMLDRLREHGVSVPRLEEATLEKIRQKLPPMTYLENPVDTGRPGPGFSDVLAAVAGDAHIDAVVAYALHEPAALRPEQVLPPLLRSTNKPLLFGTVGPQEETSAVVQRLRSEGVYVAESPDRLARAAMALSADACAQARVARKERAVTLARELSLPNGDDEHAAKQLLGLLGIPTPRRVACKSHAEAHAALSELDKPVVVKILSPEITHKTELGGVHLNVVSARELDAALATLDAIPLATERRYLIEETAAPGLELIVGAVRDASFGPTVTVGAGGTLAEALKDTATRLAPLTTLDADEMLAELRVAPLLDGWRGSKALDRQAVAGVLSKLGALLVSHPELRELEINPLRVYVSGVVALDAVVRRLASLGGAPERAPRTSLLP
jgi:acyl-CoA synthetase (NDP forming)